MVEKNTISKIYILMIVTLFMTLASSVKAQINTILKTASGSGEISEVSSWGGYVNTHFVSRCDVNNLETCLISLNSSLSPGWDSGLYQGNAHGQKLAVDGNIAGTGYGWIYGGATSNFTTSVYADVVPGINLRVKFSSKLSLNWNSSLREGYAQLYFASPIASTSSGVGYNPVLVTAALTQNTALSAKSSTNVNSYIEEGGKKYYYIGNFYNVGNTTLNGSSLGTAAASYSSVASDIQVQYIGNAISANDGDGQKWETGQQLPKDLSVKVADTETGALASNVPITFTIVDPASEARFSNGQASIDVNTIAGVAAVKFTLGTSTGVYRIKATCPDATCIPGGREVTLTETAVGNELTCASCEWSGKVSEELPTPFRLRVISQATGKPVAGASVTYQVLKFIDKKGVSSSDIHGATIRQLAQITDIYGFSRAYLKLGSEKGTYVVQARCESCLGGLEQIAKGVAHKYDIVTKTDSVPTADPNATLLFCPSGCCPVTPVLRISRVMQPNDGVSFTSEDTENLVGLQGEVLPVCVNNQNSIKWQVADAPGDYIDSGTPVQPAPGALSSFKISKEILPLALDGRPLPLAYKITAEFEKDGKSYFANAGVKQDEIDKCRQEYLDLSKPKINQDLTTSEYLPRYHRSKFTIGVDGAIDPDYVKFIDCYAHIYPSRAQDVENLRSNPKIAFPIDVTSGYRSPKKNWLQRPQGVWNSTHQFGDGVDIVPKTVENKQDRANKFKALWENTSCPKILETGAAKVMAICKTGETEPRYKEDQGYTKSNVFELANCLHLGD